MIWTTIVPGTLMVISGCLQLVGAVIHRRQFQDTRANWMTFASLLFFESALLDFHL